MELSEAIREHNQMIKELKSVLVKCGVPDKSIAIDVVIRAQCRMRQDADMLILGNDNKTIVAQFEIKMGPNAYSSAIHSLRGMYQRHKCYVVTMIDNECVISVVDNNVQPNWIKLSNLGEIKKMLGNYAIEAEIATSLAEEQKQKITSQEWNWFRWTLGVVGVLLVGVAGTLEWYGNEFSWKIYSLLFCMILMFCAASGYIIYIKVGENELRIEKKKE